MLESPGTLIPSVLVRIFLVLPFPTDHVTTHTVEVLLGTVAVLIICLNLGLCPSSVSTLVHSLIDCGAQIFCHQVYCIQEKFLPCIWNPHAGWQIPGFGMGPVYFFTVNRISRFCFTVLFTSVSIINPRHSWHTTPLNSNFEHLMVTWLPSFWDNGKKNGTFNLLQPCCNTPVYQSWYLLRNCLCWGPIQAWHKQHLPQGLQFDCWIIPLMLNTEQPNNPCSIFCFLWFHTN